MQLFLDWGPLVSFFVAYKLANMKIATMVLMGATFAAVSAEYALYKKVKPLPIFTLITVLFFGGLTLFFNDEEFIKMKPTFIYLLFSILLWVGLWRGEGWISVLLSAAFELPKAAWKILSLRFSLFFLALAILNEFIWRFFSTEMWVTLKAFGFLPLTLFFLLAQIPFIRRHGGMDEKAEESISEDGFR